MRRVSSLPFALSAASLALALATGATGCGSQESSSTTDTEGLDTEVAALVEDNDEAQGVELELETGLEDPLSLSIAVEEGTVPRADDIAERSRERFQSYFQPAGCVTSTREGNVVTHVFEGCSGPAGLRTFEGTLVSTWTLGKSSLQVENEAQGFRINGATLDHAFTLTYARVDGIPTRTRKGTSSGTTASGRTFSHTADYVTSYDPSTRCIRRDGSGETTLEDRTFSRSIEGYERCGVGLGGCPKSGTITLVRPNVEVTLVFPGGPSVDVTVNGRTTRRTLQCTDDEG